MEEHTCLSSTLKSFFKHLLFFSSLLSEFLDPELPSKTYTMWPKMLLITLLVFTELMCQEASGQPELRYSELSEPELTRAPSRQEKTLTFFSALKKVEILNFLKKALHWDLQRTQEYIKEVFNETSNPTATNNTSTENPITGDSCQLDNDLIIGIDSSGSVGGSYKLELEFAAQLAQMWKKHSGNRIGVLIYSDSVESVFSLEQSVKMSEKEIRDSVLSAPFHSGLTEKFHLAIDAARKEFSSRTDSSRRDVPKNLLLISDGRSDLTLTQNAAQKFFSVPRTKAFAIGVGTSFDFQELLAITFRRYERLIQINGFEDLEQIVEPISQHICANY